MILISKNRADNFYKYKWLCDPLFATWIVNILRAYGETILDVGCGNGYMFDIYATAFSKIGAIDPSKSLESYIREKAIRNHVLYKLGSAEKIPFDCNEFDIVLAKSSLHHFMDSHKGIHEMVRVAAKAIAIVEVVAPTNECIPFLRSLLTNKEEGRKAESVYTAKMIKDVVSEISDVGDIYQHFFDQYIEIDTWLDYSDLDENEKRTIKHYIFSMDEKTKSNMQFHQREGHYCMLRRMCLTVAFKK